MADPVGRLRAFFSELKRRRVFRVASFYIVGAWAAIEGATTILPVLGLPDAWVTATVIVAIIGFPIAVVLAWAFDVTPEGLEKTGDERVGPRLIRLPWLRPGMALALVAVIAVGGYVLWSRVADTDDEYDSAYIAVMPFTVTGSPSLEYLREGIVRLLSTNVNGAGWLHAVEPNAVLRALDGQTGEIDEATARRTAAQFGANYVIMGEIREEDGNVRLTGRMVDLLGEGTAIPARVVGAKENITSLIDELTEVLLSEYFAQRPGMELSRTAALTSGSLPALQAYLNGEAEYRASEWNRSMAAFDQATKIDSTFALAHYRLATAAEWNANFAVLNVAADNAYRWRHRLSEHDRELVDAFHAWTRGDAATAENLYRRITTEHPENAEAWYRLGEVLFHYNPVRGRSSLEARAPFERALALAPDQQSIRYHMMEIALYLRDYATFDRLLAGEGLAGEAMLRREAPRIFAGGDSALIERSVADLETSYDGTVFAVATSLAQYSKDVSGAERVARIMVADHRTPAVRATGHLLLAQLAVARGRWHDALDQLDALERIHAPSAIVHRALYAAVPFLMVPDEELRTLRDGLEAWDAGAAPDLEAPGAFLGIHNGTFPMLRAYTTGVLSVRLGDMEAARRHLAVLDSMNDGASPRADGLATGLRMQIEATPDGEDVRTDMVLPRYPPVDATANSAFFSFALDRYAYADHLLAAGRHEDALSWYASLQEGRNELFLLGPIHFRVAEAWEAAGDVSRAASWYNAFIGLWQSADPQRQPLVDEAGRRLERLRPGS